MGDDGCAKLPVMGVARVGALRWCLSGCPVSYYFLSAFHFGFFLCFLLSAVFCFILDSPDAVSSLATLFSPAQRACIAVSAKFRLERVRSVWAQ